jgi:hypothetical protein
MKLQNVLCSTSSCECILHSECVRFVLSNMNATFLVCWQRMMPASILVLVDCGNKLINLEPLLEGRLVPLCELLPSHNRIHNHCYPAAVTLSTSMPKTLTCTPLNSICGLQIYEAQRQRWQHHEQGSSSASLQPLFFRCQRRECPGLRHPGRRI